jgi:hypothetical protein
MKNKTDNAEKLLREEIRRMIEEMYMLEEAKKRKPSAGLSKKKKSAVVKKAIKGGDIGHKGKGFKDVEANAKAWGADDPKAVAAAAMWKSIKRGK